MRFAHKINTFYSQGGFAMKRIIMLLLMATMVVYLSGCSIYQGYLSYKQDEELSRERAKERQKVALKEIGEETKVLSQNGNLPGGFPVIFINDSRETVRIFVKKTGSSYRGYTWSFLIPAGEVIEPKLEEGDYFIRWTTQEDIITIMTSTQESLLHFRLPAIHTSTTIKRGKIITEDTKYSETTKPPPTQKEGKQYHCFPFKIYKRH